MEKKVAMPFVCFFFKYWSPDNARIYCFQK